MPTDRDDPTRQAQEEAEGLMDSIWPPHCHEHDLSGHDCGDRLSREEALALIRAALQEAEVERLTGLLHTTRDANLVDMTADRDSWREQCDMARESALSAEARLREAETERDRSRAAHASALARLLEAEKRGERLTFAELRRVSSQRCVESFKACEGWTIADWGNALAGEVGEACNLIKKLRRGEPIPPEKIADELADVAIYADLTAWWLGQFLEVAVVRKFNEVSERVGSSLRITTAPPTPVLDAMDAALQEKAPEPAAPAAAPAEEEVTIFSSAAAIRRAVAANKREAAARPETEPGSARADLKPCDKENCDVCDDQQ
jgi:NTP pyrophosphatase (non-canonical NTP hydrolase)